MTPDIELRTARAHLALVEQTLLIIATQPGVNRPSGPHSDACSALKDVRDAIAHLDTAIARAAEASVPA